MIKWVKIQLYREMLNRFLSNCSELLIAKLHKPVHIINIYINRLIINIYFVIKKIIFKTKKKKILYQKKKNNKNNFKMFIFLIAL